MTTDNDKDLQRFLDGDHPVSAAYRRLPGATPPERLDEAILAAAREEARRPLRPPWLVPLSVAATVMLGVGLSMRLVDPPAPTVSDMTASDASLESSAPPQSPVAARARRGRDAEPVPKPSVEELLRTAPLEATQMEKATVDVDALREQALQDTTSFEPPPLMPMAPQVVASERDSDEEASSGFAPPPPAAARADDADGRADAPLAAGAATTPQALRPGAYDATERAQSAAAKEAPETERRLATTTTAAHDFALRSPGGTSAPGAPVEENRMVLERIKKLDGARRDAAIEQQLDLIEGLYRTGRVEAAQQMLDDLVEAFPDYPVPAGFPLQPRPTDGPAAPTP